MSLQQALQRLLDAPCYHMMEVFAHPEHIELWRRAIEGRPVKWDELFEGYGASVDWPACAFWRELSARYPEALVLLSVRDADEWYESARRTIFEVESRPPPDDPLFRDQLQMVGELLTHTFTPDRMDESATKAAYEAHNDAVRATIPPERLVVWRPGDGWEPICAALAVAVPDEPFPHTNTTADFRQMAGLD